MQDVRMSKESFCVAYTYLKFTSKPGCLIRCAMRLPTSSNTNKNPTGRYCQMRIHAAALKLMSRSMCLHEKYMATASVIQPVTGERIMV